MLAQRQREVLIIRKNQRQRRRLALVFEDLPPLLMSKTWFVIVESPCQILRFTFPCSSCLVVTGRIVILNVPDQADRAMWATDAMDFCQSGFVREPVESLRAST